MQRGIEKLEKAGRAVWHAACKRRWKGNGREPAGSGLWRRAAGSHVDPAVDARRIGWKDRFSVQFKDAPGDGGFRGRTGQLQKADGAVGVVSRDAVLRALRGFAIRGRCVLARLRYRTIGVCGLTRTPGLGVFHAGMKQQPHIRFAPHLVGVQSRPEKGAQQHEPGKSQACERSASDVRRLHVSEGWSGASATAAGLREH